MSQKSGESKLGRQITGETKRINTQWTLDLTAYMAFAISRSLNFWILPVLVFGMSANTM